LSLEFVAEGTTEPIAGRAKDISVGGMFVETSQPLAFGARLTVRMVVSRQKSYLLPAVVRWTRPGGMGLQFGLLGARETHALTELINS
jgi:type IV pilus assembly protein PilZ